MIEHNYFYLVKPLRVLLEMATDEHESFQLAEDQFVEVVDQRQSATFLTGWMVIHCGPNDVLLAKRNDLEVSERALTAVQYQSAVSARQIFEPTWMDKSGVQFELKYSLEVHEWIHNDDTQKPAELIPIFLPIGTIGKIKTLSWDFEGSDDKQYWMMEIETVDGRCYDVMYPELLNAAVEYQDET
ncbi:hypothetical protein [Lactiplantibacillus fabifermentans]|uniref:Uncharacterized protein n=1 Tax=Lactiplantibacillus fabifermentans T30PCM01 TaxID=1400520 RepID=W6TCV9_9LACO|nr:hypothetical protein [Lactiplantibacillus fabifermentans]ETY75070.1 hypothetical protein LFAB_04005 [Lactiplantibacillus fabifermentans T30PCM01]